MKAILSLGVLVFFAFSELVISAGGADLVKKAVLHGHFLEIESRLKKADLKGAISKLGTTIKDIEKYLDDGDPGNEFKRELRKLDRLADGTLKALQEEQKDPGGKHLDKAKKNIQSALEIFKGKK